MYDMTHKLLISSLLMLSPALAIAQKGDVRVGIGTQTSFYDKEFRPLDIYANVSYGFTNNFDAALQVETNVALFEFEGVKTHYTNTSLGLNVGYKFAHFSGGNVEVRAGAGTTLSSNDWKYTYYGGGLRLNGTKGDVQPYVGVGVRYYDSHGDLDKNYFRACVSFGFSFSL